MENLKISSSETDWGYYFRFKRIREPKTSKKRSFFVPFKRVSSENSKAAILK